ncbi:hypothetical protein SAMN05421821_10273 [Mucilaginibacter lappiensis]|uniref:Molybdopterin-guanine dinucleotide biosynthesis protein MobB n=1 Tax=Mucilaginibacter lappiensis TaxID=354630 RepID=A0ABR6PG00_9SPHI|nr:DUF5712 family protein [Mucilaginibacter lappiensis]MBB6108692.1 hypothetical protein [Mucilaginibacter lappiensis]SIQ27559.1 hypothetical protein SAMN05421821_10273 [Mucilaginibacter lappiensis]
MFINITDSDTADNKSSSADLVHYLDKENRMNKENEPQLWFNQDHRAIPSYQPMQAIDNNIAKLSKTDTKFFLINISPSQKEIAWLKEQFSDEGAKDQLKDYAVKVMDEYARNFKRPGIDSNKDLLWFGKLENYRYFSHKDKEIQQGLRKRGERKPGEQMHIQVIVSRKDMTNTMKLSPMNNSKGLNAEHSRRMGQFDRSAFKQSGERLFDEQFKFDRGLNETFAYANAKKKGGLEQRVAMQSERRNRTPLTYRPQQETQQIRLVTPAIVQILTKPIQEAAPHIPIKKKKKRNGPEQDQGLSF